jgi:DNA-binding transcriptional LysR family regulator
LGGKGVGAHGTLCFAAPSSFAQLHIMPLLPDFQTLFPDLTLDLRLSDTSFYAIEGSFDLALRSAQLADSSLKGRKLSDDTRVLCASLSYLETHGTPTHPSDLSNHRFIAWSNLEPRELLSTECEIAKLDPQTMTCRTIVDDGDAQREATVSGVGIAISSLWNIEHEIAAGRLVRVLPEWSLNEATVLWLVYPRSNVLTPKTRIFIDFLIKRLGNRSGWSI